MTKVDDLFAHRELLLSHTPRDERASPDGSVARYCGAPQLSGAWLKMFANFAMYTIIMRKLRVKNSLVTCNAFRLANFREWRDAEVNKRQREPKKKKKCQTNMPSRSDYLFQLRCMNIIMELADAQCAVFVARIALHTVTLQSFVLHIHVFFYISSRYFKYINMLHGPLFNITTGKHTTHEAFLSYDIIKFS